MYIEGQGIVAPAAVWVALTKSDLIIAGDDGISETGLVCFINNRMGKSIASLAVEGVIDLGACGPTLQVKPQRDAMQPGSMKRVNERRFKIPITADVIVFTRLDREKPHGIWLLGWVWAREIDGTPIVPALDWDCRDIEVPAEKYHPMADLIKEFKHEELTKRWQ